MIIMIFVLSIAAGVCLHSAVSARIALEFPRHDPLSSIQGLIQRRFGDAYVAQMSFKLLKPTNEKGRGSGDAWSIEGLEFSATSATALGSAIQWYMKNNLHVHYDWYHEPIQLPPSLPKVTKRVSQTRTTQVTYYANVCTVSYSMWSWDWSTWEKHIDWMVLNGINLPLAFTGQEKVWQQTFQRHFNISQQGLDHFFAGAAFLAWNRMGNLQGSWGDKGPLPQHFIDQQYELQLKILKRMREFGMLPAVPCFAGFVPGEMKRRFPNADIKRDEGNWGIFPDENCCVHYVEPTDPLFHDIALAFLTEWNELYPDSSSIYQCDTYNEMSPESFDSAYLNASSSAVISGIRQVDPNGIWLMQGWLFQSPEWTNPRIKAYLEGVPDDQMIILDLKSETGPVWSRTSNYFGKHWIYCVLHNFGGNLGMRGDLTTLAADPLDALRSVNSTMLGIGLTMEGIYQNYPVYDLALHMNWETTPVDIYAWVSQYASYRYGSDAVSNPDLNKAWDLLLSSVYNCTRAIGGVTKSIVEVRPNWKLERQGFMGTAVIYDSHTLYHVWRLFLSAAAESSAGLDQNINYRHDLVDITRQVLSDFALKAYKELGILYDSNATDYKTVCHKAQMLLEIISDMDSILGTHEHFLLGRWLAQAHALNRESPEYYDYQARNQITRWGENNNNSLGDYASKQWSGLVKNYYGDRWNIFLKAVCISKQTHNPLNFTVLSEQYELFEQQWNFNYSHTWTYPTTPAGSSLHISRELFQKYANMTSLQSNGIFNPFLAESFIS